MISKKDITALDKVESFLPENFEKILKKIRSGSSNRFKKLGIFE